MSDMHENGFDKGFIVNKDGFFLLTPDGTSKSPDTNVDAG